MLSAEQAALLIKYYRTVELTGEQKQRLTEKYWEANSDERRDIARAYAHVFAGDAEFIQRLLAYHDIRQQQLQQASRGEAVDASDCSASPGGPSSPNGTGAVSSPTTSNHYGFRSGLTSTSSRMPHSQLLLRTAIQDHFPKLSGSGPFTISFGLAQTEQERRQVVDLYSSQFTQPDPPELQRLVTLPQTISTRTRRRINGSCTWYVRCHTTNEIACAVTITAHHHQTHHFVEMPLFATAAGYKRHGFGRLLNAALVSWCAASGFEYIMISADVQAIPFWKHLGYDVMSRSEKKNIAFYYEHECYKFKGAEPMIGYCRSAGGGGQRHSAAMGGTRAEGSTVVPYPKSDVGDVLQRMARMIMVGVLELPSP